MLAQPEKAFHDALVGISHQYGPIDQNHSGIWVGYVPAEENEVAIIGVKCGNCSMYAGNGGCQILSYQVQEGAVCRLAAIPDNLVHPENMEIGKSMGVGSMVTWGSSGGSAEGKIKRIIHNGKYNVPDSNFEITGTQDNPAVVIEVYRDGKPSGVMVGHKLNSLRPAHSTKKNYEDCGCAECLNKIMKQSPCWDGYVQRGMKPGKDGNPVPNCVPAKTKKYEGCSCPECLEEDISCSECDNCNPLLTKSGDTYTPNAGMKAAARRALKWKEDGKATGAGTPVGWGRASDIVAGRSMSLDTVKRMYSFFSRHEVDKKGKDWNNSSNPSNGKIMWEAWGGDAGFAWSRAIVNAQKTKKIWLDSPFFR
jgi:hypothetical protein